MRRFGLYNAVKQGKMTAETGDSNQTIFADSAPPAKSEAVPEQQPRKKYSAYRTILSRHEEAASRIPDAVPDEPRSKE